MEKKPLAVVVRTLPSGSSANMSPLIVQKHGIVLGPDLNINGDVGVEGDECPGADPASQPAQDSQTAPAEGNSMLGKTHCGL